MKEREKREGTLPHQARRGFPCAAGLRAPRSIGGDADRQSSDISVSRALQVLAAADVNGLRGHARHGACCCSARQFRRRRLAPIMNTMPTARDRKPDRRSLRPAARWRSGSDAGTPLVSDPGHRLVEGGPSRPAIRVVPIPPVPRRLPRRFRCSRSAGVAFFFGRLSSAKGGQRRSARRTQGRAVHVVFFESPRPLAASLAAMVEVRGDRTAAVSRELTKTFGGGANASSPSPVLPPTMRGRTPPRARNRPSAVGPHTGCRAGPRRRIRGNRPLLSLAAEVGASRAAGELRADRSRRRPDHLSASDGAKARCRLMPLTGPPRAWQGPSRANGSPRFCAEDKRATGSSARRYRTKLRAKSN